MNCVSREAGLAPRRSVLWLLWVGLAAGPVSGCGLLFDQNLGRQESSSLTTEVSDSQTPDANQPLPETPNNAVDPARPIDEACLGPACEADHCFNGVLDGDETEADCGGACGPCGVRFLSVAQFGACAIHQSRQLFCWGSAEHGGRGDGSIEPMAAPTRVLGLEGVTHVDAGNYGGCAVAHGGEVWCWGRNDYGALGYAPNDGPSTALEPHRVELPSEVEIRQVVRGYEHACVLSAAGEVWCWGRGIMRGVAPPPYTDSHLPARVVSLENIRSIAAGIRHTCALRSDGAVLCWGEPNHDVLGRQTSSESPAGMPGRVLGFDAATQLGCGYRNCCITDPAGQVWCWGENSTGALGLGHSEAALEPQRSPSFDGAVSLTISVANACAVMANDEVWCAGRNNSSLLANGTFDDSYVPVLNSAVTRGSVQLGLGAQHACFLDAARAIVCWGSNDPHLQRASPVSLTFHVPSPIALP